MYLVTGIAGFIGFHFAISALKKGESVIGVDNFNTYYDIKIKKKRIAILNNFSKFTFVFGDLNNKKTYSKIKKYKKKITYILHFSGQAGVRYSIQKPEVYLRDNTLAYLKILEFFKNAKKLKLLLFASSSSVYGEKKKSFSHLPQTKPVSVYAVSKLSMELLSNVYNSIYGLNILGLRFFTVFGPWGRPDMAYYKFTKSIIKNKAIEIYNKGNHARSFTYIDDVINNIFLILKKYRKVKSIKFDVFNIGNPRSISLMKFIKVLEKKLKIKAKKKYIKKQLGDVLVTYSNLKREKKLFRFKFSKNLEKGMDNFVNWFKKYNEV